VFLCIYVADYPVGLQSRVLEVKSVLDMGSDRRVHMVGVHGIGECPLLGSLILNFCKYLREIKGIPPTLRCENESLTSSSRSMLLNKVFFLVSSDFIIYSVIYLAILNNYLCLTGTACA
jgi:hypothetical protein